LARRQQHRLPAQVRDDRVVERLAVDQAGLSCTACAAYAMSSSNSAGLITKDAQG
jgi:hypothetical protein